MPPVITAPETLPSRTRHGAGAPPTISALPRPPCSIDGSHLRAWRSLVNREADVDAHARRTLRIARRSDQPALNLSNDAASRSGLGYTGNAGGNRSLHAAMLHHRAPLINSAYALATDNSVLSEKHAGRVVYLARTKSSPQLSKSRGPMNVEQVPESLFRLVSRRAMSRQQCNSQGPARRPVDTKDGRAL